MLEEPLYVSYPEIQGQGGNFWGGGSCKTMYFTVLAGSPPPPKKTPF